MLGDRYCRRGDLRKFAGVYRPPLTLLECRRQEGQRCNGGAHFGRLLVADEESIVAAGNGSRSRSDGKRQVSQSARGDGEAPIVVGRLSRRDYRRHGGKQK